VRGESGVVRGESGERREEQSGEKRGVEREESGARTGELGGQERGQERGAERGERSGERRAHLSTRERVLARAATDWLISYPRRYLPRHHGTRDGEEAATSSWDQGW
jgi:hypothetical protein